MKNIVVVKSAEWSNLTRYGIRPVGQMFDCLIELRETVNCLRTEQPFPLPEAFLDLCNRNFRIGYPPAGEFPGSHDSGIRDVPKWRNLDSIQNFNENIQHIIGDIIDAFSGNLTQIETKLGLIFQLLIAKFGVPGFCVQIRPHQAPVFAHNIQVALQCGAWAGCVGWGERMRLSNSEAGREEQKSKNWTNVSDSKSH